MRELSAEGRSVARLDDETVTAARLAAVVEPLIEIHGQHEQQRLLSAAWQRDVLDAFGGHAGPAARPLPQPSRRCAPTRRRCASWRSNPSELERRLELAEHAADEIEAAAPRAGEVDELRGRLAVAGNAQRIAALLDEAHELLAGETSRRARSGRAGSTRVATELARLDPSAAGTRRRAGGLEAEIDDIGLELRRRRSPIGEATLDSRGDRGATRRALRADAQVRRDRGRR